MSAKTWDDLKSKHRLGRDNLKARFMDAMRAEFDAMVRSFMDLEGFVTPGVTVVNPAGPSVARVEALSGTQILATDGSGTMIDLTSGSTDLDVEAFEATVATPYHVALSQVAIPAAVAYNPTSGTAEFTQTLERVGLLADPTTAIDDGDGTMTFIVDSVTEALVSNAGRKVRVWKKTPRSGVFAVALEELTVQWNGAGPLANTNYVATTSQFGQTGVPSVVAADYSCALLGPEVKKNTNLKTSADRAYVGTIEGDGAGGFGAVDLTNQRIYDSGLLAGLNEVLRIDAHGFTKIRVQADAADANEPQIDVEDVAGNHPFSVDENGNLVLGENLPAFPDSPTLGFVDDTGAVGIKTIAGDLDVQVPDASVVRIHSPANTADLQIDRVLTAVGVLELEDVNTPAPVPLSSATDTVVDPELATSLIGGINEADHRADLHAAHHDERAVLTGGLVANGGGGLLDFPETYYVRTGGFGVVVLPASAGVNPGGDGTYWAFVDSSANAFATAVTMASVAQDDVLLARVVKAGGLITSVVDLRLTRAMTNGREITSVITVGPSGMFATLKEAVDFANEVMAPSVGNAQRRLEIHVVGDTTETATSVISAKKLIVRWRPGSACSYSTNIDGIHLNACDDLVLDGPTFTFTGNADDAAALSRIVIDTLAASLRVKVRGLRVNRTGTSAWHGGIRATAALDLNDCVFEDILIEGASDFGVAIADGLRHTWRDVRCTHVDPNAGSFQNTAGNGFHLDSTASGLANGIRCVDWAGDGIKFSASAAMRLSALEVDQGDGHGLTLDALLNTVISDVLIRELGVDAKRGINIVNGSGYLSIDGIDVLNCDAGENNVGIYNDGCDRIRLSRARITSTGGDGIVWSGADRGQLSGFVLTDIGNLLGAGDTVHGVLVTGNGIKNTFSDFDVSLNAGADTEQAWRTDAGSDENSFTNWIRNGSLFSDAGADTRFDAIRCAMSLENEGVYAANARRLTIQLEDDHHDEISHSLDLEIRVLRPTGIQALVGEYTIVDAGAGAMVTAGTNPRVIFSSDPNGVAVVDITDATGAAVETVQILVTVQDRPAIEARIAAAFA